MKKNQLIRTVLLLMGSSISTLNFAQVNSATMYNGGSNSAGSTGSYYGTSNNATGYRSFSGGYGSVASGNYSVGLGYDTDVIGHYSFGYGYQTDVTGNFATSIGTRNLASGPASLALGIDVKATADRAMVIGSGNEASNPLVNNISKSLMVGFYSNVPTFFVGPANGVGSYGNVGIGTSTPLERLHVNGNLLIPEGGGLKLGTEESNSGHVHMLASTTQYYNNYWDIKGNLYFRRDNPGQSGGAVLGIQHDGTVTIGVWEKYDNSVTDTDGHKLMVNGGILCEKIKVIADVPNSDHVFESDYDLRSLEEVKSFVEEKKHLPEIPSAKDFKENGYSIGEMDDLLLRKVEELTLYMIQLKEKVDVLESENAEFRSIIETSTNN